MVSVMFKDFKFPEQPTSRLVKVTELSSTCDEKVVKDFFQFCGKIEEFEMCLAEDGASKEALVLFEKEGSAKTANMLSHATIGDKNIIVEPYYKESENKEAEKTRDGASEPEKEPAASEATPSAEGSTSSGLINALLTTGYQLTQTVVQGAQSLDSAYGISTQAVAYLEKAKEETKKLDEKYGVSERAVEIDSKLGIRSKINTAASTAAVYGRQALETEQGKKVGVLYERAINTASELKDEALRAINLDSTGTTPTAKSPSAATFPKTEAPKESEASSEKAPTPEEPKASDTQEK